VQFELPFGLRYRVRALALREQWLRVGTRHVRLWLVPNRRARRYVLRLARDGSARVTVPRGGSAAEAIRFAEANVRWLERQLLRQAVSRPRPWGPGTAILFRGEKSILELPAGEATDLVGFNGQMVAVADRAADLRPEVERHLWRLAARELPQRVIELAVVHALPVRRVVVRNQRSRWGSCSRTGTISLNWRLVQAPEHVRDYIILHELAHLRQMNHSRRFWTEVERLCPEYRKAERWLKLHAELLRSSGTPGL
jgi:predicted metal-dependent hydrolase